MKALSRGTGIAISLVSGFLVLALLAELYYLLCLKKKKSTSSSKRRRILRHQQEQEQEQEEEEEEEEIATATSPAKELLYLFCWKKPSSLSSSEIYCTSSSSSNSSRSRADNNVSERSEDLQLGIDAELMRLHSLSGPPRFLFTIKEETKEDLLEFSEDGKRSRKTSISRSGRSLSDLLATTTETPYLTPISSPQFFESFKNNNELSRMRSSSSPSSLSSPPPKFKFLRDAEEKLYRKILTEEALRVHRISSGGSPAAASPPPMTTMTRSPEGHEDGPFITIIISKGQQQQQQQHPTPSQVNPLPSSPPSISTITSTSTAAEQGKHVKYFGTNV